MDPREILTRAATTEVGVTMIFESREKRQRFRAALYRARTTARDALLTAAPLEVPVTGWDDLVIHSTEGEEIGLWIGTPTLDNQGILEIREGRNTPKG